MQTSPDKRLALQAYEQILGQILGGAVAPGELVNERRIATELEMSRTPVRDALLMLEGEGLLIRQGRVLQVKQMRVEDYMDALDIRLLLEPEVAHRAAGGLSEQRVAQIRETLHEVLRTDAQGRADRALVRTADEDLHGSIAEASGNPQLAHIIETLRRRTQMFDLRSMPERLEDTCAEHLQILDAVARGDGTAARTAMREHLEAVRSSILGRLAGL